MGPRLEGMFQAVSPLCHLLIFLPPFFCLFSLISVHQRKLAFPSSQNPNDGINSQTCAVHGVAPDYYSRFGDLPRWGTQLVAGLGSQGGVRTSKSKIENQKIENPL